MGCSGILCLNGASFSNFGALYDQWADQNDKQILRSRIPLLFLFCYESVGYPHLKSDGLIERDSYVVRILSSKLHDCIRIWEVIAVNNKCSLRNIYTI
jgi:hypothetical protein